MRKHSWIVLAVLAAACSPSAPRAIAPAGWRFSQVDSPIVGTRAMVASEHPLSSEIGAEIMRQGGNAIDAAVAVGFAQAVVNPRAGNIGGGGFLVYREASGQVYALDYREKAPGAAHRDMYLDSAGNVTEESLIGAKAAGVPGSVSGPVGNAQAFRTPAVARPGRARHPAGTRRPRDRQHPRQYHPRCRTPPDALSRPAKRSSFPTACRCRPATCGSSRSWPPRSS